MPGRTLDWGTVQLALLRWTPRREVQEDKTNAPPLRCAKLQKNSQEPPVCGGGPADILLYIELACTVKTSGLGLLRGQAAC